MSYLTDRLTYLTTLSDRLLELERECAHLRESRTPLAHVLPGVDLVADKGPRCEVRCDDWFATSSYSNPIIGTRFTASVNGKDYQGSVYLHPRGAELYASFTSYHGELTDSARRRLSELVLGHYGPMISADEVRAWGRLAMLESELVSAMREVGSGVRWWKVAEAREAVEVELDKVTATA